MAMRCVELPFFSSICLCTAMWHSFFVLCRCFGLWVRDPCVWDKTCVLTWLYRSPRHLWKLQFVHIILMTNLVPAHVAYCADTWPGVRKPNPVTITINMCVDKWRVGNLRYLTYDGYLEHSQVLIWGPFSFVFQCLERHTLTWTHHSISSR